MALSRMKVATSLDEFSDIVFSLDDGSYIKGNSFVLKDRSEYFRAMLGHGFKETSGKLWQQAD
jgi:hypothetical protein